MAYHAGRVVAWSITKYDLTNHDVRKILPCRCSDTRGDFDEIVAALGARCNTHVSLLCALGACYMPQHGGSAATQGHMHGGLETTAYIR